MASGAFGAAMQASHAFVNLLEDHQVRRGSFHTDEPTPVAVRPVKKGACGAIAATKPIAFQNRTNVDFRRGSNRIREVRDFY